MFGDAYLASAHGQTHLERPSLHQQLRRKRRGVELPFGGYKASGYGREKGFEALYGFTQLKTVAIKHD